MWRNGITGRSDGFERHHADFATYSVARTGNAAISLADYKKKNRSVSVT
jgi:hypothetical protein